jgi:hypothetical protein
MKNMLVYAAAALLLPIGLSIAADPPELKEGLWSNHTQSIDNSGAKPSDTTTTICRNHAYDQHARSLVKGRKGCTTVSESFQGGKYTLELHCVIGNTVVDSKGTTTFQGDTAAHAETHATYAPPMGGISEITMIMDSKYVGSCPAGAQPGDITNQDGTVNHWKH